MALPTNFIREWQSSGLILIRNTHDASASAEVVAGPKICLYWNRDGLVYVPARLLQALPQVFAWGVAIWVAW
jgi:hypothetical protein